MLFNVGKLIVSTTQQDQLTTNCRTFQPEGLRQLHTKLILLCNAHNQFAYIKNNIILRMRKPLVVHSTIWNIFMLIVIDMYHININ